LQYWKGGDVHKNSEHLLGWDVLHCEIGAQTTCVNQRCDSPGRAGRRRGCEHCCARCGGPQAARSIPRHISSRIRKDGRYAAIGAFHLTAACLLGLCLISRINNKNQSTEGSSHSRTIYFNSGAGLQGRDDIWKNPHRVIKAKDCGHRVRADVKCRHCCCRRVGCEH
jgi:hypothetical protein